MITFFVGVLIGGLLGITFMTVFFIGKQEDTRRHELHDNFEVNRYKQKIPSSVDNLNTSL